MIPKTDGTLTGSDGSPMMVSLGPSSSGGKEPLMLPSQPASQPEVAGPGRLPNKTPFSRMPLPSKVAELALHPLTPAFHHLGSPHRLLSRGREWISFVVIRYT